MRHYESSSNWSKTICKALYLSDLQIETRCAPGVTRTPDLRIRNPLLYPAELRAQITEYDGFNSCEVGFEIRCCDLIQ